MEKSSGDRDAELREKLAPIKPLADEAGVKIPCFERRSVSGQQIEQLARMADVSAPESGGSPAIRIDPDLNVTAKLVGQVVGRLDLFDLSGDLVYFDHAGNLRQMTGRVFRTWINDYVIMAARFDKDSGEPIRGTLRGEDAAAILDNVNFRRGVRTLLGVNRVRMPVLRADGSLEALPWGYDSETQIYTIDPGWDYNRDASWEAGRAWLEKVDADFPFSDARSRAVQRAGMLALYVRHLPGCGGLRPGFLWLGNQAGCGKSILAKACLYPTLGSAAAAKMKRGEELDKELEAFARARVPYIFLDNIYGGLASASIDQLLTSKKSTGRAMGGHSVFESDNTSLLLITGNRLELNEDAARRFVVIDLFEEGELLDRVIHERLDDELLESVAWRKKALEALWTLVAQWHAEGCPKGPTVIPTYERFCETVGGIVTAGAYADPFVKAVIPDAIHSGKGEFLELLKVLVEEMGDSSHRVFSIAELAKASRACGVYQEILGNQDEGRSLMIKLEGLGRDERLHAMDRGDMTPKMKQAFGIELAKYKGKLHCELAPRRIRFGKRQRRHSEWEVSFE